MRKLVLVMSASLTAYIILPLNPTHAEYNPTTGRFLQRDPVGVQDKLSLINVRDPEGDPYFPTAFKPRKQYRDGANLYQYVKSRPVIALDPSGRRVWLNIDIVDPKKRMKQEWCGGAEFHIRWGIEDPDTHKAYKGSGWIVQHVVFQGQIFNCLTQKQTSLFIVYYEVWRIDKGDFKIPIVKGKIGTINNKILSPGGEKIRPEGTHDLFKVLDQGDCTRGWQMAWGQAHFFEWTGGIDDKDWKFPGDKDGHHPEAGSLPTRDDPPADWGNWNIEDKDKAYPVNHTLGVKWDCCKKPYKLPYVWRSTWRRDIGRNVWQTRR